MLNCEGTWENVLNLVQFELWMHSTYLGEERGHSRLGPIATDDGHNVAEDVRLGDGAVDVGDDDLVGGLPPVDVAVAPRGALVRRRHAELRLVHPGLQVELFLRGQFSIIADK